MLPCLTSGSTLGSRAVLTAGVTSFRVATDLVLFVHLLLIGFVAGGGFLTWRWPRIVWVHVPAMTYGALIEFVDGKETVCSPL